MVRKAHDDELVMNLVEMALSKPAPDRRSYVSSACGQDTELEDVVWRYVESEQSMNGFLLSPLCPPLQIEDPFEPGELLDGRFRIVRELARGGMGIVYEAYDERLDRRIALKCARAGFRKRLPPEVRHASDISHPNVCKIYEIHTAATRQGEVDFLTMEFVDGETLAEKVKRGPLAEDVARKVALQICEGLAEAHRKEVVHGDLKSANVIVTADESGAVRAVITDFGLAQRPRGGAWPLVVGGTPDYMAPELWKGAPSSVATDIYSLGVILRELIYGQEGEAPARGGSKWDAVIAKCMEEDPGRRFAAASDVASALAPRTRRWAMAAVAAALVGVLSGAVSYRAATGPSETVRLAVEAFEPAPLYQETERRVGELKSSAKTRFVSMPGVDGATHVLRVALQPDGEAVQLKAELRDARSGVNASEWSAKYERGETKHIAQALAGMVTGAFHLPGLEASVNESARQDYWNGLYYLRRNSTIDRALPLLERAAAADSDSPLTHAALAEGYLWKYQVDRGEWLEKGEESLRRAQIRNPDLAQVLTAAGFRDTHTERFDQSASALLRAIEIAPRNGDAYRRLGIAYQANGEGAKALAAFRQAVQVEPDNYRNHQALADYFQRRAQYEEAAKHLSNAVELAAGEPRAHYAFSVVLANLGRFDEAERQARISLSSAETPESLSLLGAILSHRGRDQESVLNYQRALQWWPDRYLIWVNLGTGYRRLGLDQDSRKAYQKGLDLAQAAVTKNPRSSYARSCLAYSIARLGDARRAESEIAQALSLSPNDHNVVGMAVRTYEAMGRREDSLALLRRSPREVRADMGRNPDLADLHRDLRFQKMMAGNPDE